MAKSVAEVVQTIEPKEVACGAVPTLPLEMWFLGSTALAVEAL